MTREPRLVEAFATVPRERFLGPGPWRVLPRLWGRPPITTATNDPRELCHDLLVAVDEERDLNNGLPSLWAHVFDQLAPRPGETVLQIGAGVGYFTAVMASSSGPRAA